MYLKNNKKTWLTIALFNLCIVASLGILLRCKMLFEMEGLEFKNLLHAHSHFAFGGWVTLALLTFMTYEILPKESNSKKIYPWLLFGILFNSVAMMIAFLVQGYAFFSILFSTLFVIITHIYSYIFIKDILRSKQGKSVIILAISSVLCLILSSAGPFTLAYIIATKSGNVFLYRDAVYTYLHLQYNGFFALSIFAVFLNKFQNEFNEDQKRKAISFATTISISVIPTLFISYLWHFPNLFVNIMAALGCIFIVLTIWKLIGFLNAIKHQLASIPGFIRNVGLLSFIAFSLKSLLQMGTMIPKLGVLVFGDRTIIIGYLHLVLLGFVSLFILASTLYDNLLSVSDKMTRIAIIVFVAAAITNETILAVQGFGNIFMLSNSMYTWMLFGVAIWLFSGAVLIFSSRLRMFKKIN